METLIFVLGSLSGLFLFGMVYSFIGVLKMSKKIKNLEGVQEDIKRLIDQTTDNTWREFDSKMSEIIKHADYLADQLNRKEDQVNLRIDKDFTDVMSRIDETNRYIDSRIDKTVDVLCTRMDVVMDEHKKEFEHVHLHIK